MARQDGLPSHGSAPRQPRRHPRARPDARARLLRRKAPRRPRRRRGEGRAACGRPGAPPRALLGRHRRPRALAPLARDEHLRARPDARPRARARPRALLGARGARRRGARDRDPARPWLAGAPRPQPAPGPRRAHALRRDGAARCLARLRPHRDRDERQPLLDRRSRPRPGALLAPGVVLPRRHRGRGRRRLRAPGPRPDRGGPARRRRSPGGDGDAEHRHRRDVQDDRQPRRARRRLHAPGEERRARDLAVPGRLRVLRVARRPGPHSGARRHGEIHGRARHGVGGAQDAQLEDLQPQPLDAGRGGRAQPRVRRVLLDQDDGGALPRGVRAEPDARAHQRRPRDRRLDPARGARVLRRGREPGARAAPLPGSLRQEQRDRDRYPPPGAAARRAHRGGAGRARPRRRRAGAPARRGGGVTDLFAGTTILEFGGGAAGPVATRYFADHGATVIRVESRQRPDFLRTLRLTPDSPGGLDGAHHFAVLNANKLSVALNLSRPEGVAVARRLALWAEAVAENFAPGAMAKGGLEYAALVKERPDLVMISTCLNGQTGPERHYPGFGGQGSALAGFNHLTGWPDREPVRPFGTITDSLSARFAALLLASALLHRRRTGQGQHIDLAQVEAGIVCLSESLLTYTANGEILTRMGNRSRHAVPHGVFRCADEDGRDRWAAIAVHDDEDWRRLAGALGRPAWTLEPVLATVDGRRRHEDEIEARLTEWTATRTAADVAAHLQAAGLDAAPVEDFGDLHDHPQLAHRRHFRTVEHDVLGTHPVETHAIRFSAMEPRIERPAPRLGADTDVVLRELLGIEAAELDRLRAAGVLE